MTAPGRSRRSSHTPESTIPEATRLRFQTAKPDTPPARVVRPETKERTMRANPARYLVLAAMALLVASTVPANNNTQTSNTTTPLGQVLYISDSAQPQDGVSYLFRVIIDPITQHADLIPLANGRLAYNQLDAIACTPDGSKIYFVDKYSPQIAPNGDYQGSGTLGYYDVATGSTHAVDILHDSGGNTVPGIVLAGFSPSGTLFVASEDTDYIYKVNLGSAVATPLGQAINTASGTVVHEAGADLAFSADGTAYIWTNTANGTGAPSGLYQIQLSTSPGSIPAHFIGSMPGDYFNGIAIQANGYGDLAGCSNRPGYVHSQSLTTAADDPGSPRRMYLNGTPYTYSYGDMSNGALGALCTRTIGYYKNHDWYWDSVPASMTICGVVISQNGQSGTLAGQDFLNGVGYDAKPNGTDFSMLVAQLIAAKLNIGNGDGFPLISEAEDWLCNQGIASGGTIDFHMAFSSKEQATMANYYASLLDQFNNKYETCQAINSCTPHLRRNGHH